ncbi:MAG: hypothetical protein H0U76_20690 [Ktedonobacteraceae bacterium]|nr:hypothetical protein [Ktedonobacteraceae bacterium]
MQNYFNYYTEIEEHFQRRRGTLLMLSALDWSLIATWQEAGFPLEAVLAGIDATFDKYAARQAKGKARRINGLAYCAQEVLRAMEDMHEAATGASRKPQSTSEESGFETSRIARYLRDTAEQLRTVSISVNGQPVFADMTNQLRELADSIEQTADNEKKVCSTESLEQRLLAMEDQLFVALQASTSIDSMVALREQSARELAPYRSRLQTVQIRQIEQQFLRRCLFQQHRVPRLSLFYMPQI